VREGSIDTWLLILTVGALAFFAGRIFSLSSHGTARKGPFVLPPDVTLRPGPLLTETELLLYNLIRMAVQDHYLVFARVPLWCILTVEAEGAVRVEMLRHLALKRLDFVLVHPGSREVEQVVQIEGGESDDPDDKARRREIQRVVQAAGIRLTTLNAQSSYTVTELEQLFGLGEPE
jgi:hypothetical protein